MFTTYRGNQKQTTQIKNRIHSLPKEKLYGFTQEEIFDKKSRKMLREMQDDAALAFQIDLLFSQLEHLEMLIGSLQVYTTDKMIREPGESDPRDRIQLIHLSG